MRTHYHAETNRFWIYKSNHRTAVNFEWQLFGKARFFGIELTLSKSWKPTRIFIGIPFLVAFWITFGDGDDHGEYEVGMRVHDWTIYLMLFNRPHEWNSDDPWYRTRHSVSIPDLVFGRSKCVTEELGMEEVDIPMPEGVYKGVATHERRTWTWPRRRTVTRESTWIKVEGGIPFPGKGENSWDCGMDGLFGAGIEGMNVELAIGNFVGCVLSNRRQYGGKNWRLPSKMTVSEADKS